MRERALELTEQYDNGEISEEEYRNGMAEIWVEQGEKVGTIPEGRERKGR